MNEQIAIVEQVNRNPLLPKRIAVELERLGVPKNILGYIYLKQAILMAYNDFKIMNKITKRLYPEIASENETTPSRVERAIRHAIERAAFITGREIAGNNNPKPSNSVVIAGIADRLRTEDGLI